MEPGFRTETTFDQIVRIHVEDEFGGRIGRGIRRVALVTGAGSGIGRAAAIALAETGFAVVLAGRRKELLEAAAAEAGEEAKALTVDVCDSASVSALRPG